MVYYNQEAATSHAYCNLVALLPREDPLEEGLTVAQNLQLSAHLCLPPHFTRHRKASLIQEVLDLLALGPLQHCLVGSPAAPGQSIKWQADEGALMSELLQPSSAPGTFEVTLIMVAILHCLHMGRSFRKHSVSGSSPCALCLGSSSPSCCMRFHVQCCILMVHNLLQAP